MSKPCQAKDKIVVCASCGKATTKPSTCERCKRLFCGECSAVSKYDYDDFKVMCNECVEEVFGC